VEIPVVPEGGGHWFAALHCGGSVGAVGEAIPEGAGTFGRREEA